MITNPIKRAEYAKAYRAKHRAYFAKKNAEWKRKNKAHLAVYRVRNYNSLKISARAAVHYAVKVGKLTRGACAECNTTPTHAHHTDYKQKLLVVWLCKKHHTQIHLKMG